MGCSNYASKYKTSDLLFLCDKCGLHTKISECKTIESGWFSSQMRVCKSCYREYKINKIIKD